VTLLALAGFTISQPVFYTGLAVIAGLFIVWLVLMERKDRKLRVQELASLAGTITYLTHLLRLKFKDFDRDGDGYLSAADLTESIEKGLVPAKDVEAIKIVIKNIRIFGQVIASDSFLVVPPCGGMIPMQTVTHDKVGISPRDIDNMHGAIGKELDRLLDDGPKFN
jgi:hypothetical protein